jgi:hypothetical protein
MKILSHTNQIKENTRIVLRWKDLLINAVAAYTHPEFIIVSTDLTDRIVFKKNEKLRAHIRNGKRVYEWPSRIAGHISADKQYLVLSHSTEIKWIVSDPSVSIKSELPITFFSFQSANETHLFNSKKPRVLNGIITSLSEAGAFLESNSTIKGTIIVGHMQLCGKSVDISGNITKTDKKREWYITFSGTDEPNRTRILDYIYCWKEN